MQDSFRTPRTTRFLIFAAMALVLVDMGGGVEPALTWPLRVAIGLCGIGAVSWFLAAVMRFRR